MPQIPLRVNKSASPRSASENPLPQLLHTPSGLALLDLQGTFHFPTPSPTDDSTLIGKLVFPLYNPDLNGPDDTNWMKRVYLYVGANQRMAGQVKKLPKPFAVIRKVDTSGKDGDVEMGESDATGNGTQEELEIVEVVRYKIVFSTRPEPVSTSTEDD
jgi:chromosome transmission fidelity protein 8